MRVDPAEVTRVLEGWLGQQRWYAGKSRQGVVQARWLATLAEAAPSVQLWIADVSYPDGDVEHYQVPLVLRRDTPEGLAYAYVGAVLNEDEDAPVQLYDALHDKEVTGLWLDAIAQNTSIDDVEFVRVAEVEAIPVGQPSLALSAEQSNTSLVFGDTAIMKCFRRIEPGLNPDIEIHAELTRLGARHVASLLGHVTARIEDVDWSLAMLQDFMTTATDGWQLATASVRDLMAEGDLHASEAGGDFSGEAFRLGTSTAEVHTDLAEAFGSAEFTAGELRARAGAMNARLDAALLEVPQLLEVETGLRQAYADLAELADGEGMHRVHGDLHLGQVLRTAQRWVFLDFEGEPSKRIAERRALDSPLRDVAGMLRSFDYAARHQLIDIGATPQSEFRATEWADRNRQAFCEGYAEGGGLDPLSHPKLVRAFEADKAVYEVVYESRNRPNWLPIPLASLHRLALGTPSADSARNA
jgi:maltokinase